MKVLAPTDRVGISSSPIVARPTRLGPYSIVCHVDELGPLPETHPVAVVAHTDNRDSSEPTVAAFGALIWQLLLARRPFLAVCLGHQILSGLLGFETAERQAPAGEQTINLFGHRRRVRFDNRIVILSERQQVRCLGLGGMIHISRDARTGEVNALRGPGFLSVQFHPESAIAPGSTAIPIDLERDLVLP